MSIRFRLNALIIAVFSLGLILLVLAMIIGAGPRIQAENDSTMRLGKEFVETTIASLQGTPDPGARLEVLLDGLKQLRHVHIYRIDDPLPTVEPETTSDGGAPEWLMRMGSARTGDELPVVVNGVDFGTLVIAPRLADEAAEVWSSIVNFSLGGAALVLAAVLLMSATIAYLLRPIRQFGDALMVLESGKFDIAVPEKGPPEISDICRKLNRLAATLESTISENRRLAQRIIRVQDEERKDLARELHDELGPYHFAIRAAISALKSEAQRETPDRQKLLGNCEILGERVETIQRMNRGVLLKLRPLGLEEYGLKAKLTSLLALLRESHPHVRIDLSVDNDLPICDETSNLTLYRLVQEGLTNALRHSHATAIDIVVETLKSNAGSPLKDTGHPIVHVSIVDDGRGLPEGVKTSYGIAGMSERVWATGGEMRLTNRAGGGLALDAWVPALAPGNQAADMRPSSGGT